MQPESPARILIVRLSHLGDLVHALPVHHALRRRYPAARLAWAVQPEFAPLLVGLPGLGELIEFERRGGPAAWLRLWRRLRAFDPELSVDCQGNWKSAVATRLSGAARRLGAHADDWREPSARHLMSARVPSPSPGPHAVDRMLHLAAFASAAPELVRADFDLGLTAAELTTARDELEQRLGPTAARPVLLHLARPSDPRSWPAAAFAELARSLVAAGRSVLVVSGPGEQAAGLEVEELAPPTTELGPFHWVGQRGLRALAALFRAAAERDAQLVACDSGPLHLAWSRGLDVRLLAGPQDPRRTGPWPAQAASAHDQRVLEAPLELACRPCLARRCSLAEGPLCMTAIEPAQVLASLVRRSR